MIETAVTAHRQWLEAKRTQPLKELPEESLGHPEIIRAYHGQAAVEAVFAHLKDPVHLALRPQHHWTDQKLHVHVLTCVLGYLLATLLHPRARRANSPYASLESLLDALSQVRRTMLVRPSSGRTGKGPGERVTYQLEEIEPEIAPLLPILGVPG